MFDTADLDELQARTEMFQIPMFAVDLDGTDCYITALNSAHCETSGLDRAQVLMRRPEEFLSAEDAEWVLGQYHKCADLGAPIRYSETLDLPKGRFEWHTTLSPILDRSGRVTRLIGNALGRRMSGRRPGRPLFFKEVDHLTALIQMPIAQARQLIARRIEDGEALGFDDRQFLDAFDRLCAMAQCATRDLSQFTRAMADERPEATAMLDDGTISQRLMELINADDQAGPAAPAALPPTRPARAA